MLKKLRVGTKRMASQVIITKTVEENKHTNKNVETFYQKERQR